MYSRILALSFLALMSPISPSFGALCSPAISETGSESLQPSRQDTEEILFLLNQLGGLVEWPSYSPSEKEILVKLVIETGQRVLELERANQDRDPNKFDRALDGIREIAQSYSEDLRPLGLPPLQLAPLRLPDLSLLPVGRQVSGLEDTPQRLFRAIFPMSINGQPVHVTRRFDSDPYYSLNDDLLDNPPHSQLESVLSVTLLLALRLAEVQFVQVEHSIPRSLENLIVALQLKFSTDE
ncbi:MAG: hypothetical protein EA369_05935 [Bradymonadales bacterium]|nr:MAG: hypothetical protein EA369_05935 [Bradymonadales bacterium]